jgi:uncharacterized membrane protein YoaK (UPF0700 family)
MSENQHTENTEEKKEDVISDYYDGVKEMEMQGYESGIKNARTALYVTAALVFIGEIISASIQGLELTALLIIIAIAEAGVFIGLALWTKTKPFTAIITGLIVFILMWVAAIIFSGGQAVYSGIIVRVIILVNLIKAIKPAKAWEDAKKR